MSDDVETKSETSGKSERKPLSLRRTETGAVKQSFSHGRSKTVVVETKRRRVLTPKKAQEKPSETKSVEKRETKAKKPETKPAKPSGAVLRTLSEDEKNARAAALIKARKEEEVRRQREAAAREEREQREADERAKLEEERQRLAEEEAKRAKEAEARRRAEEEARELLEREEEERRKRAEAKQAKQTTPTEKETPKREDDPDNPLAKLGGRLKTRRKNVDSRSDSKAKDAPRRRTAS